jgi:hypothetical protein
VMKIVKQLNTTTINEEVSDEVPQQYQVYSWGGGLHLLPEDFEIPGGYCGKDKTLKHFELKRNFFNFFIESCHTILSYISN